MTPAAGLCAGDLAHGVMEGQAEDLDMKVNGVAGQVAFGPAPVAVFDDETGIKPEPKNWQRIGKEYFLTKRKEMRKKSRNLFIFNDLNLLSLPGFEPGTKRL